MIASPISAILCRLRSPPPGAWRSAPRFPAKWVRIVAITAACASLISFSGPTTATEFAGSFLLAAFSLLLWGALDALKCFLAQPMTWCVAVLAGWQALTLTWSADVGQGAEELANLRWVWLWLVLAPVLAHRRVLLWAYALGFLLVHATQLWQGVAPFLGADPLWSRAPGRISGWLDPVVGGSLLCGALGVWVGLAWAERRHPLIAIGGGAGGLVALVGIIATGTRGAWIASAVLLMGVAGALVVVMIRSRRRPSFAGAAVGVLGVSAMAALSWPVVTGPLDGLGARAVERAEQGIAEVTGALERQEYNSDTGARVAMNVWAAQAFAERPVRGVGAGGYRSWVEARLRSTGVDPSTRSIHDHAHSALLHALATLGAPGGLLWVLLIGLGLAAGWGRRSMPAALGIVGLVLAGAFDTIQVNSQTAAHLFVLLGLCQPVREPMVGGVAESGGDPGV